MGRGILLLLLLLLLVVVLQVGGGHVRLEMCAATRAGCGVWCGVFLENQPKYKKYRLYSLEMGVAGLRPSRLSL
jgi:hypothetical protein